MKSEVLVCPYEEQNDSPRSQDVVDLNLRTLDGLNEYEEFSLFNLLSDAVVKPESDEQNIQLIEKGVRNSDDFTRSPPGPPKMHSKVSQLIDNV